MKSLIEDIVDSITSMYRYCTKTFPEKLKRSISFFIVGWNNYDFDYEPLHQIVLFKLKRMLYCYDNYGFHSEECENYKPKMKSIKLAIKLLEKYVEDKNRFMEMHDKKWGKATFWFEESDYSEQFGQLYQSFSKRPNAITDEEKEQERKEFSYAYSAHEREQDKRIKIAYGIISKYNKYWWD